MKSKNKKQKQRMTRKTYNIVVPYALETTTQSYKEITWSKYGKKRLSNIFPRCGYRPYTS